MSTLRRLMWAEVSESARKLSDEIRPAFSVLAREARSRVERSVGRTGYLVRSGTGEDDGVRLDMRRGAQTEIYIVLREKYESVVEDGKVTEKIRTVDVEAKSSVCGEEMKAVFSDISGFDDLMHHFVEGGPVLYALFLEERISYLFEIGASSESIQSVLSSQIVRSVMES